MPPLPRFDTSSLSEQLGSEQKAALKVRRQRGDFGPTGGGRLVAVFVGTIAILVVVGLVLPFFLIGSASVSNGGAGLWMSLLPRLVFFIAIAGVVVVAVLRHRRGDSWYSLATMAERNGLSFRLASSQPSYPGLLFQHGSNRTAEYHLYAPQGLFADAGGYRYVTGAGKNRSTHRWNFAAFRLPNRMPHLVLDARDNNLFGFSNLPSHFADSQRVPLGAPVGDRYTLYAPDGYGQDAFYLFPPDALEDLMRAPANYDIEIVDDWLFFYTKQPQDLFQPHTWRLLEGLAGGFVARVADLATRYRDGRLEAPAAGQPSASAPAGTQLYSDATRHIGQPGVGVRQVAEPGRRLRKGWPVTTLALLGVWVLFQLLWRFVVGPLLGG